MHKVLLIAAGGGAGALLRYWIAGWTQRLAGGDFPWGTLLVNVLGCCLIGLLNAAFLNRVLLREEYRIALFIGLLGGFTTFSSFAWETTTLTNANQPGLALLNVLLSNLLCIAGAWFSYRLGIWALGAA